MINNIVLAEKELSSYEMKLNYLLHKVYIFLKLQIISRA